MRQTDTAAMARNLYRNPASLLTPMLDCGFLDLDASPPVTVALEFPVYTGPVAAGYALFGVNPLIGRVLSAICSVAVLPLFWALSSRVVGRGAALLSTVFLAFSYESIVYGRVFIPDSAGVMLSIASLEGWLRYLDRSSSFKALVAGVATFSAILIKITNAYVVGVVLLVWVASRNRRSALDWRFLSVLSGSCGLALVYYAYVERVCSRPVLVRIVTERVLPYLVTNLFSFTFYKSLLLYGMASLSPLGPVVGLVGIALAIGRRDRVVTAWALSLTLYLLVVGRDILAHHSYYFLHVLPLLAIGVALGITDMSSWLKRRARVLYRIVPVTLALFVLSWSLGLYAWKVAQEKRTDEPGVVHARQVASFIQAHTDPDERVAVLDGDSLLALYLSDRKGWGLSGSENPAFGILAQRGCDAVFIGAAAVAVIDQIAMQMVASGEAGSLYRFRR